MALGDAELPEALERLAADPADPSHLAVAEALVQRGRWTEVIAILEVGRRRLSPGAGELLAQGYVETGRFAEALAWIRSLSQLGAARDVRALARLRITALERAGELEAARKAALDLRLRDARDPLPRAVLARLATLAPMPQLRGADPFYTAARAERYAERGHPLRALRVYRRLRLAHPEDEAVRRRVVELERATTSATPPTVRRAGPPLSVQPSRAPMETAGLEAFGYEEDEVTVVDRRPELLNPRGSRPGTKRP